MRLAIGSDHAGFKAKEGLKGFLLGEKASQEAAEVIKGLSLKIIDVGCYDETSCDYPVFAKKVAEGVLKGDFDRGLLICGTGIGMSIMANRFKGVRAALCHDLFGAKMARLHNDANVLTVGARVTGIDLLKEIVLVFLTTPFEGGRHERRVRLFDEIC